VSTQQAQKQSPISLPKGGGAIKGIGETFQPNLFSGTGSFSIPIVTSPGRNGFGPELTVQYSSGNGNGPFGLGWQLSLPRVSRKTEKGLPSYTDADVFVMSGAEDLVPYLTKRPGADDEWESHERQLGEFTIHRFRPRTEGQFALIERWADQAGVVHWRATTKGNVTSIYGRSISARIVDPNDPQQIYDWLLEETFDAKGNHMLYEYVQEEPDLNLAGLHERNRRYTQAYIRRILYGNTPDNLDDQLKVGQVRVASDHVNVLAMRERHYLFEALFDYGDFDSELSNAINFKFDKETTIPTTWPVREDPFSSFRAGFEIRTLRRCERVLMLHHFNEGELIDAPLVKSTDFAYNVNPNTRLSLMQAATVTGYRKDQNDSQQTIQRSMPPVMFKYSEFEPQNQRYQTVSAKDANLPSGSLASPELIAMDVFGNGLPDIVQDSGDTLRFWQNLGQGKLDGRRSQAGEQPAHSFSQAGVSIGDLGGDGLADMVVNAPPVTGFYESSPDGRWADFKRFDATPNFQIQDANTRFVDLTGDGLSDVLVTRDEHFVWYRSLGESGYAEPKRIPRKHDLDLFPDVYFDDPAGRVRLADITGDGLSDIVLVHDGRIDYWPNLGYGRFGKRITMSNTPRIGFAYDPRRLFLADLDGSGGADLVYVEQHKVHFWFNQSGNGWSAKQTIKGTPNVNDLSAIQFIDFYGTGTTTLLWSYDASEHPEKNYKLLDFCGGNKPNLLIEMDNNMGATTRVQFAPSTKFYLEDKAKGKPWVSNLPFPVQVVEKTEVIDHVSKTKLVTTYKYHHGYYDGREREFRGFGRVDQFDTEFFDDFSTSGLHEDGAVLDNTQKGFHTPPVETRSWFHTGIYFDKERHLDHRELTEQYRAEYYQGDTQAFELEPHTMEQANGEIGLGATLHESAHEAHRVLRGAVLRTEVYGRDGSNKAGHPYTVTENRYHVKTLQPKADNPHAVYLTVPQENISYHYEREPADPRISHNLTLSVDDFGNVTDSVAIGYPRRIAPEELPEQGQLSVLYSHADFINQLHFSADINAGFYYAGIGCQSRAYEVTGLTWQLGQKQLTATDFDGIQDNSIEVDVASFKPFEWQRAEDDTAVQRRIIEWSRNYFRTDADPTEIDSVSELDRRLALGEIESLALPYGAYQAAFTSTLLADTFADRLKDADLGIEGGYHPRAGHELAEGDNGIEDYVWLPSGRQNFNPEKFFQSEQTQDPFGNRSNIESDAYALLLEKASDALPAPQTNVVRANNDYRVLQADEVTDPNGNKNKVAFDALGLVVGTAILGQSVEGEAFGDSLQGFIADLPDEMRDQHIADPLNLDSATNTDPHKLLGGASSRLVYDLHRFANTGEPNLVYSLTRETHVSEEQGTQSKVQHACVYSDGFGRESQSKVQAEPDKATPNQPRWVGTGTTVYNNKGEAVQQYEPFFSTDHHHAIEQHGVSPTIFFDPLGRLVCIINPNHTYEKVLFDPWQQTTWDSNDTVLLDPRIDPDVIQYVDGYFQDYDQRFLEEHGEPAKIWHQDQLSSDNEQQRNAALKSELHANTPSFTHLDSLARPFLSIADNGLDENGERETFATRVKFDIEGNQLEVTDALQRVVMRYDYDIAGNVMHQASMEAGERWMLNDVGGNPLHAFDSRGHHFRSTYDALRRPVESFVANENGNASEQLVQRTVYGEARPNPEQKNLRGQVVELFDSAGVVSSDDYDFKGNLLSIRRQLAKEYKANIDWSASVPLETEVFTSHTRYDALNRPIEVTAPDSSIVRPTYNEANLLEKVEAHLQGSQTATPFVNNIDYDAKGQRQRIDYGNGASTNYQYDPFTYRMTQMRTQRDPSAFPNDCPNPPPSGFPGCQIQNLHYTYDPVGNITHIRDDAQQTIFFNNQRVEPSCEYAYDATYRLIDATGREHLSQSGGPTPHSHNDAPRVGLMHPGDGNALGRYSEQYVYDAVGNILAMQHRGSNPAHPGWSRSYTYNEASLLEISKVSNRLTSTKIGDITESYAYEGSAGQHGNITSMPHLSLMQWDYRDQLQATSKQAVKESESETTFYVYDGSGERVRKLTELANGALKQERLYLGGFEVFRSYNTDGSIKLERETLYMMDDNQRIALIETRTIGTDSDPAAQLIRYQFGNHLGSASLELDGEAKVISYEEYTPYGSTAYQAGRSQNEVRRKLYRYTGMERDEESGFGYHSARYYLPWLARWSAIDRKAEKYLHLTPYNYSFNSPIKFGDYDGNEPTKEPTEQDRLKIDAIGSELEPIRKEIDNIDLKLKKQRSLLIKAEGDYEKAKARYGKLLENARSVRQTRAAYKNSGLLDAEREIDKIKRTTKSLIKKRDPLAKRELKLYRSADGIPNGTKRGLYREVPLTLRERELDKKHFKERVSIPSDYYKKSGGLLKGFFNATKKMIPGLGTALGVHSMINNFKQGNYGAAFLDAVSLVPIAGDIVDAGTLVYEGGRAAVDYVFGRVSLLEGVMERHEAAMAEIRGQLSGKNISNSNSNTSLSPSLNFQHPSPKSQIDELYRVPLFKATFNRNTGIFEWRFGD